MYRMLHIKETLLKEGVWRNNFIDIWLAAIRSIHQLVYTRHYPFLPMIPNRGFGNNTVHGLPDV
jgi:hypothetical protein